MRKINKRDPLPAFLTFKEKNPSANWDTFHEKAKDIYNATREMILMEEQNCLCGYTEIPFEDFTDAHLDHFLKKSLSPKDTFNWNNLIAATLDDDFGANHKDKKYKIQKNEYGSIFNPVKDNVEHYFDYNFRGEIIPQANIGTLLETKVKKTIEVFNLNHETLKKRRALIINHIEDYKDLSKEEIRDALSNAGFVSVVNQYTQNTGV
jgi:uncharacterized protein (TIGR02646 family)